MRIKLFGAFLMAAIIPFMGTAQDRVGMFMKTPFTESVSRTLPLPEHPRPQFEREKWINLNGQWDYTLETCNFEAVQGLTKAESWTTRPIPASWTGKILVPFSIDAPLSGVGHVLRPQEVLWYGRKFEVPAHWQGQRVLLHFQASDWETGIYVNGQRIGQHRGGYDPFSFDITPYLKKTGNVLNVCVWDATEQQAQSIGKQIMPENRQGFRYQPTGGIWQTVWLEAVPKQAIEKVKITPEYDDSRVKLEFSKTDPEQVIRITIKDGNKIVTIRESAEEVLELDMPAFKAWSPENPHLYDIEFELLSAGKVIDKVKSYFGMRKIEIRQRTQGYPRIYLNNEEVFQYGPLDQGYWPDGVLTPPSEEAILFDLEYLKKINANMIRVHIKTHPGRWYYHADRLGLLVWQDMICMPKYGQTVDAAASAQWAAEFKNMVDWLYNHPSIVLWIVFNEAWSQHDTEKHTEWIMSYDPSRIVTCASGWNDAPAGNVVDLHDYTFYPKAVQDYKLDGTRVAVLGEAGGMNLAIPGHTWYSDEHEPVQRGHRNYTPQADFSFVSEAGRHTYETPAQFEDAYRKLIRSLRWLRTLGTLNAVVYTQITDVEHELNGWLTYDRMISKIPVEKMNEINSPLYKKMETETVLNWGGIWKDENGNDVKLPAGEKNPYIAVVTETKAPIVLKTSFEVSDTEKSYCIGVKGFSDYEISINNRLFRQTKVGAQNFEPSYSFFEIYPDEKDILKQGKNEIEIKVLPMRNAKALFDFAVFRTK